MFLFDGQNKEATYHKNRWLLIMFYKINFKKFSKYEFTPLIF